jgi:hypothetical protein
MHAHGRDQAQATDCLGPHRDALEHGKAIGSEFLRNCQHRGHDDRARVHRPAFEGVVEILAMRGGAVDERAAGSVDCAGVADGRRAAGSEAGRGDRSNVVAPPCRHAKPDHVQHQVLRHGARARRQPHRVERGDALGESLRDRFAHHDGRPAKPSCSLDSDRAGRRDDVAVGCGPLDNRRETSCGPIECARSGKPAAP